MSQPMTPEEEDAFFAPKVMRRTEMAMNENVVQYINSVTDRAIDMLGHFAIEMHGEELYSMLCGGNLGMLDAFSRAAHYMEPHSYHGDVGVPVLLPDQATPMEVPFIVRLKSCYRYPCYLMPERRATITPESKLYQMIAPSIKLAQEWQMTRDLFKVFSQTLNSDQMAQVLPWTRELARDAVAGLSAGNNWRFMREHGMSYTTASQRKAILASFNRLANPMRASRTPALSSRINQATRLGDRLFAQYRMLGGKSAPIPEGSYFLVSPSEHILPDWYRQDMKDILAGWHGEVDNYSGE